jgi:hypothetical protein
MDNLIESIDLIGELNHEDSIERFYKIQARSYENARELFGMDHPLQREHCQHEYDCCGHYYRERPKFYQIESPRYVTNNDTDEIIDCGTWIVIQTANANI